MASSFIVDPNSVSMEEIRNDIKSYLDSAPDSLKWKDYFATGTGKTLIDLIAGLGAFISYNVITGRRENYLPYVQNRSSALGISEVLGYSAFRGRNATLTLTVVPSLTTTLAKFSSVGTVKDQDLILLETTPIVAGVSIDLKVVVGLISSETKTVDTTGPSVFRFTTSGVSHDIRVFLNATEVPTSEHVLDLVNEKFTVLSNVFGSANVSYLNLDSFITQYNIGDTITLYWVALLDTQFATGDVAFDFGTLTSFIINENYKAVETTASIQVNAPLFNETQFIIRGRDDYMKTFRLLNINLLDTSYTDISAALVDLCYVQLGSCLFTNTQLTQFVTQLSLFRPMGLKPPTISHPTISFLDLNIGVKVNSNTGNPTVDVETILAKKENMLEESVVLDDLENSIEDYSYIKIARATIDAPNWVANNIYRYGKHAKASPDTGFTYRVVGFIYKSGAVQPVWPNTLPLTQTIIDNRVVWQMVNLDAICPPIVPPIWLANHGYEVGDIVVPTTGPISIPNLPDPPLNVGFKMIRSINKSKSNTAAIAALFTYTSFLVANFTYDGTLFVACYGGTAGNSITLFFDGVKTVQQVINVWNLANPSNCVKFSPLSQATHVSPALTVTLTGGANSSSILFTATTPGANGNNISITFDGFKTVNAAATTYNAANPTNQVTVSSPAILPISTTVALAGGVNTISGEPVWPGNILPPC